MMEFVEFQHPNAIPGHQNTPNPQNSQKAAERVGEDWPPLLSKKWLAIHFGCWNGTTIARKRFRSQVLTPEVLEKAGIPQERAYSVSTKTFNVIDSMKLTLVLRGFCLIAALFVANTANAQNNLQLLTAQSDPAKPIYLRDTILRDTFPGLAMVTDSTVRMVSTKIPGTYRYEAVLGTVCVEAIMIKDYRYLVRAEDGGLDPFDLGQRFFFLTGGQIDPKRIVIFKQYDKK